MKYKIIIQILIVLISLYPFTKTSLFSVSTKFIVNEQESSKIDLDSLGFGLNAMFGSSASNAASALDSSASLKNEIYVKELLSSKSKIAKFIEAEGFEKHIFPGKWDFNSSTWKKRTFMDKVKFFIKSLNRASEDDYKNISHIPSSVDLSNKFLKDNLFFNFDFLNETFEITCRFQSTMIAKKCIDKILLFIDEDTRNIHAGINVKFINAISEFSLQEVDINKKKVLNNLLLNAEIEMLKIENDPNYVITIIDGGLGDKRSSDRGRLLFSFLIFLILNILLFIYPRILKILKNILEDLKLKEN